MHHDDCTCHRCTRIRSVGHALAASPAIRVDGRGRPTHTSRGRLTCVGCDATPADGDLRDAATHDDGCMVGQALETKRRRDRAEAAPHLRALPGPAVPHRREVPWPALRAV